MCVIYACTSATPSKEELDLGAEVNRDGAGICWIKGFGTEKAKVAWAKGLASTSDAVLATIEANKITYPFAIHYRSASIGPKCDELTHPFPITDNLEDWTTGTARRVLMHNGHIAAWMDWFKQIMFSSTMEIPMGPWSDSRALAACVNVKGEGVIDFIAGSSRVLVLDSIPSQGFPKADPESYLRYYGSWVKKTGYQQSCETARRVVQCSSEVWRGRRGCHYNQSNAVSSTKDAELAVKNENTWTVDELESLVSDIRKEQNEARILLGC